MDHKKHTNKVSKRDINGDGRIGRLDEQTLGYYRRVSESIKDGFSDQTEKDVFLKNIFKQLSEEFLKVSQNQTASRILEDLLHMAEPHHMILLIEPVSHNFEVMCCDKFASHVIQTMMTEIGNFTQRNSTAAFEDIQNLEQCMRSLWAFFKTSIGLYMQHTYASHVLRAMIEVIGGVNVSDSVIRSRMSSTFKKGTTQQSETLNDSTEPKEDLLQELKVLYKEILGFVKLEDYLQNSMSNPVIQTVILVLRKRLPKSCDKMCKKLLKYCFKVTEDENSVAGLVTDACGSHLVEQIMDVVSPEVFDLVFHKYIEGKIASLALHPVANFVLQKLMQNCYSIEQFEAIFGELSDVMEDLMARNHLGVVVKLAEGALKHGSKQEKFVKCLMKCLHCYKPVERQSKIVPLTASLTTYEVFYKVKVNSDDEDSDSDDDEEDLNLPTLKKVNYHGSLVLQKLLWFSNCKTIVTSLLELKVVELVCLSCDPCGSHVIDTFISSDKVGDKNKDKLYSKLKDGYISLASSKNGSRTLDTLWTRASLKQKINMAEELGKHAAKLKSDRFGHHIWRNFALQLFTTRKEEWKNLQMGQFKKRKMFEDLVSTHGKKKVKRTDNIAASEINNKTQANTDTNMQEEESVNEVKKGCEKSQTSQRDKLQQTAKKRKRVKTTKITLKASHLKTNDV